MSHCDRHPCLGKQAADIYLQRQREGQGYHPLSPPPLLQLCTAHAEVGVAKEAREPHKLRHNQEMGEQVN